MNSEPCQSGVFPLPCVPVIVPFSPLFFFFFALSCIIPITVQTCCHTVRLQIHLLSPLLSAAYTSFLRCSLGKPPTRAPVLPQSVSGQAVAPLKLLPAGSPMTSTLPSLMMRTHSSSHWTCSCPFLCHCQTPHSLGFPSASLAQSAQSSMAPPHLPELLSVNLLQKTTPLVDPS